MDNRARDSFWFRHLGHAAVALALALTAAPAAQVEAQQREAQAAEAASGVVNIQTASAEELQRLPGIGPSKAAAIIEFRERNPFRRVEDILRVRGIGRATFRRLRPMISVSGPTTLASDVRMGRSSRQESEDETEEE